VALCVILAACPTASTILSIVDALVQIAAQAAEVQGAPPIFVNAALAAYTAGSCAALELASMDTALVKSQKTTACITPALAQLTAVTGLSPNLQMLIQNLAQKLQDILNNLPSQAKLTAAKPGQLKPLEVSPSDRSRLLVAAEKLKADAEKLKANNK
jgi:siderophore synthetase component